MQKPGINIAHEDVRRAAVANGMTVEDTLGFITRTSATHRADHPAEYRDA